MNKVRRSVVDELFRGMHTIKGTSALFSMGAIAAKAHEMEEILRTLGTMRDAETPADMREALLSGLEDILGQLREAHSSVLSLVGESGSGETQYVIGEAKLDRIIQESFAAAGESAPRLKPVLTRLKHIPASRLFRKYRSLVENTATKLGKSVALTIESAEEAELSRDFFRNVDPMLLHLIRNAIDHGIETPEAREARHKQPQATITLKVARENGSMIVGIADDGGGINLERIRQVALERGFLTAERAKQMPRNELIRCLFMPGFSTKGSVTDLSGRGVGLDVVRHNVEKLGGRLRLMTKLGAGTSFEMAFPMRS